MSRAARALIAAAKRDLPSPDLEGAILGSLGIGASTALAPSFAMKLWTALKHAAASKASIGVLALGTAASGGYVAGRMQERALLQDESRVVPATTLHSVSAVSAAVPASVVSVSVSASASDSVPVSASVSVSAPVALMKRASIVQPPPPPTEHASLAAELDAIHRARADVLAGSAKSALAELDAYAAAHPQGELEEEALALRVRADRLAGDSDAASRALADLETRFPKSVHLGALRK